MVKTHTQLYFKPSSQTVSDALYDELNLTLKKTARGVRSRYSLAKRAAQSAQEISLHDLLKSWKLRWSADATASDQELANLSLQQMRSLSSLQLTQENILFSRHLVQSNFIPQFQDKSLFIKELHSLASSELYDALTDMPVLLFVLDKPKLQSLDVTRFDKAFWDKIHARNKDRNRER